MTRAEKRTLAMQLAREHALTVEQVIAATPGLDEKLLGTVLGLLDSIDRAMGNGTDGFAIAGVVCGCNGGGLSQPNARAKPDCPRCRGTGTVPIASIRQRAEEASA